MIGFFQKGRREGGSERERETDKLEHLLFNCTNDESHRLLARFAVTNFVGGAGYLRLSDGEGGREGAGGGRWSHFRGVRRVLSCLSEHAWRRHAAFFVNAEVFQDTHRILYGPQPHMFSGKVLSCSIVNVSIARS